MYTYVNKNYVTLSNLFVTGRAPDFPVTKENNKIIYWQQFENDVRSFIAYLEKVPNNNKRWLLYCDSAYAFAVGLFALWHTGSTVIISPDDQKRSLLECGENSSGLISDKDIVLDEFPVISPFSKLDKQSYGFDFKPLSAHKECLELYTSGSTGKRRNIVKKLVHIAGEIDACELIFGETFFNLTAFATVSHQHIYGFIHRLLFPICAGRLFISRTYFFPEQMIAEMKEFDKCILISGPALLKRLPKLIDLSTMNKYCKVIFSSGGLLDAAASKKTTTASGIYPIEGFGSTETGMVAWRSQTGEKNANLWKQFINVEIRADEELGLLQVRSPFVSEVEPNEWFSMGDKIEMVTDVHFKLLGRADRILKIEEKRLLLDDMEKRLNDHEFVEKSIGFPFVRQKESYKRTQVAIAIILSEKGKKELEKMKDKGITVVLKKHLQPFFSALLLPKIWRYVNDFPLDMQGKATVPNLQKLI